MNALSYIFSGLYVRFVRAYLHCCTHHRAQHGVENSIGLLLSYRTIYIGHKKTATMGVHETIIVEANHPNTCKTISIEHQKWKKAKKSQNSTKTDSYTPHHAVIIQYFSNTQINMTDIKEINK